MKRAVITPTKKRAKPVRLNRVESRVLEDMLRAKKSDIMSGNIGMDGLMKSAETALKKTVTRAVVRNSMYSLGIKIRGGKQQISSTRPKILVAICSQLVKLSEVFDVEVNPMVKEYANE